MTCLLGAGVGVAVAADRSGSITVTRAGTVLDGRQVDGYIHVKADDVVIRNSTIRYDGNYALRIFGGFSGALIENTKIYCGDAKTHGVVFGNYTARGVDLIDCSVGFRYAPDAPATIVDSTWNGKPVSTAAGLGTGVTGSAGSAGSAEEATGKAPAPDRSAGTGGSAAAEEPAGSATGESATSFPTAATTGVPTGTSLRRSGSISVETNGQVISGLDIYGCVTVAADNVVIRKSRIRCGSNYAVRTLSGATNLLVEDVEIDGLGRTAAAVCCANYTVRRTEIKNVLDGPRLGDNTVVEDSWIHHLTRVSGSHNDTLQTTGAVNVVARRNRLEAYNPDTRDPMNACLMIGSSLAPIVADLIFENNYCNGGNYSVNLRDDLNARNLRFSGNVFGRNCRYGAVRNEDHPGSIWDAASNVWADSGAAVVG